MGIKSRIYMLAAVGVIGFTSQIAQAIDIDSTVTALRLANTITGGLMPSSDPLFTQMVAQIQAGNTPAAANIAATSNYAANYLARRLALQMQNPALDATIASDNDATAFLMAHFVGTAATKPSLSTIWSENATYMLDVGGTSTHAASLSATQLNAVNWNQQLVQVAGQTVVASGSTNRVALPAQHVGGYATLSDRANDNSFAMYGATAGTNLRMIEGIWEISTGMALQDFEADNAVPQDAPRFVPEYDPNFFHANGQTACISCHGGGLSAVPHGYAAVADVFDFDATKGFTFIAAPTTATMKSLGSDPNKRAATLACNLASKTLPVCNPDSLGVGTQNAWDLTKSWQGAGLLSKMGWTGPVTGNGLNALGAAIGQASIVYQNFTKRVINEICPTGTFQDSEISAIADKANPYAAVPGTDDIRTIIAAVATQQSCL